MNALPERDLSVAHSATSYIDTVLLLLLIVASPFEFSLPKIAGYRSTFLLFGGVGAYCICFRSSEFIRVCLSPIVVCGGLSLVVACIMESMHPTASYVSHTRYAYMLGGCVAVSTLARSRAAYIGAIYAVIGVGLTVSVLMATAWKSVDDETLGSAHQLREAIQGDVALIESHVNELSAIAVRGFCGALTLFLVWRGGPRWLAAAVVGACLIGVSLPASRGGLLSVVLCSIAMWYVSGRHLGGLLLAMALGAVVLASTLPSSIWDRMTVDTTARQNRYEGRVEIYTRAIAALPETIAFGVGYGNYYADWAFTQGIALRSGTQAVGVHNCVLALITQWGILAAIPFVMMLFHSMRHIGVMRNDTRIYVFLVGLTCTNLVHIMLSHHLASKQMAITFGLLNGVYCWFLGVQPQSDLRDSHAA